MTVAPIRWGSIQQGQQVFNLPKAISDASVIAGVVLSVMGIVQKLQ